MQLTSLTVVPFGVVLAIVTHTSAHPLAGSKYSWVKVAGLRMPIALTPLAFMRILVISSFPRSVVVEGSTAVTGETSSIMLANADLMDLNSS